MLPSASGTVGITLRVMRSFARSAMSTVAVLLTAVLLAGGCADPHPAGPKSPLAVIVSGDTAGWIVPCGCTSKQDGGLLRRGTYVTKAREQASVVLVDVGGAPGGSSPYEQLKFAAILRGELAMGLAAHNLGAAEAALGAEAIRRLAKELNIPFVSCNVRDADGQLVAEPLRVVEAGGRKLAVVGALSPAYAGGGLTVAEPRGAVLAAVANLKTPFDVLVVLAYLPEDELQELAKSLPEADLVLGGPTRQPVAPRRSGPTTWAAATNKGKFLVHLRLPAGDKLPWEGEVVELGPEWADDERQVENLDRFHAELAKRDFAASETGLAAALAEDRPADFRVAGTGACQTCHAADCAQWSESAHGHAWTTLVDKRSQFDPYCQQCHTTGYGLPGGFESVARSPQRTGVGCESCHGPSLAHAERPRTNTMYAARDLCVRCHDRENSPQFEYAVYWPQIEHGQVAGNRTE
jgi:predicted CXXCH cytochrome family protein